LAAGEQVAIFARRCQSGCGLMRQEPMERRVARNSEPARLSGTCCSQPRTATGRALRAVAVGYLDAHLGCQLSGGDVTSVTVSGRPEAGKAQADPACRKRLLNDDRTGAPTRRAPRLRHGRNACQDIWSSPRQATVDPGKHGWSERQPRLAGRMNLKAAAADLADQVSRKRAFGQRAPCRLITRPS
jgi:hypothetical protein